MQLKLAYKRQISEGGKNITADVFTYFSDVYDNHNRRIRMIYDLREDLTFTKIPNPTGRKRF